MNSARDVPRRFASPYIYTTIHFSPPLRVIVAHCLAQSRPIIVNCHPPPASRRSGLSTLGQVQLLVKTASFLLSQLVGTNSFRYSDTFLLIVPSTSRDRQKPPSHGKPRLPSLRIKGHPLWTEIFYSLRPRTNDPVGQSHYFLWDNFIFFESVALLMYSLTSSVKLSPLPLCISVIPYILM